MSTETDGLAPVAEAQVEPPVEEQPQADETQQAAAEDEPIEGAVEFTPGTKYVPLSAVTTARREAKELKAERDTLKAQAERAAQLEAELAQARPYAEFFKVNPHLLQQPAQPMRQPEPQHDAEAEEYARNLDLYAKDGTPDIAKARKILDVNARIARESAQTVAAQTTEPVARMVESQKVLGVVRSLQMEKDADGNTISEAAVNALAQDLVSTLGQAGARQFMAQDGSYNLLKNMAFGKQATLPKRAKVAPPAGDPLVTERAGGKAEDIVVSTQHLGKLGLSEERYKDSAKRFKPGQFNSLE